MSRKVSLKEFASQAIDIIRRVDEGHEALIVTRGKRACAIVVPMDDGEVDSEQLTERELSEIVQEAEMEIDRGEFVSLQQAKRVVRKVWAERGK